MKKVNPEYTRAVLEIANRAPCLKLLSIKICRLDYGYCKVEADLNDTLNNPFGSLHGGMFSLILDTVTYWALYCCIDEGYGITTVDLQSNNLAAVNSGKIIAEGRQIKVGRTLCLAKGTLKDESGKLLAYGTSKIFVAPGLQSIDQAVDKAGFETMPQRFL